MFLKMKFPVNLLLFSSAVFLVGLVLFSTVLREYFLPVFYLLILYFPVLSITGRVLLNIPRHKKPGDFNIRYFLVRWTKVLLHLVFIMVYIVNYRENALAFVITFLACYVLFSVFDIYVMSERIKKSNQI